MTPDQALQLALGGGDDYELCFTVPSEHEPQLEELATALNSAINPYRNYHQGTPQISWYHQGKSVELHISGWEHFHHGELWKNTQKPDAFYV